MNFIYFTNDIITIISFIVNLCFICPFLYRIYKYFTQKIYINKVLSYNKDAVQIYQATYEFNTVEGYKYDFVTCNSLKSIHNILDIFEAKNQKFTFVDQIDNAANEICIGGPLPNKRVNSYFVKYFKNFKYVVNTKYENIYENYPINTQLFEYSDDKIGFKVGDDIFLETEPPKKDYAFLIKLTNDDFKLGYKRTVHILFGGRSIGTIKATEYLQTQYKEIYRKYKQKHYFFAIEINLIDNSFNQKMGIIDLTNEMFSQ